MSVAVPTDLAFAHVGSAATLLLARDADGPEFGKASPLGLLLVLLLLVGTVFLIRSMNRHLRNLPSNFSRDDPGADQAADEGTDPAGASRSAPDDGRADDVPTPDTSPSEPPGAHPQDSEHDDR